MKKIIFPIILVVVLLGVGLVVALNKGRAPSVDPLIESEVSDQAEETSEQERFIGSLKDLLGLNKSVSCR